MGALWDVIVKDWLTWIIIGLASVGFFKGLKDQKVGTMVWAVVLGSISWYFVKNPETVMNKISEIWSNLFS